MIIIDMERALLTVKEGDQEKTLRFNESEAFEIISDIWLRCGWDIKYVYGFSWLGRPIIQLPEDMIRIQEVIYTLQPDIIIETGIAHGGSLIFYSSLCKAMGKGRVIGVDIEIRPHNRQAIESHPLFSYITLVEGSSTDLKIVERVRSEVKPGEKVLILLDSNHTKDHVLKELKAYSRLVSKESYIVAMDGIMEKVVGASRTEPDWAWNNPRQAALEFVEFNRDFEIQEPPFSFNEGMTSKRVTYWPDCFIKRIK